MTTKLLLKNDSFLKDIPGWLSENEGRLLTNLAAGLPKDAVIVEIGSFQGKSTVFLGLGLKSGKIYAIDPHKGQTHATKRGSTPFGIVRPTYFAFLKNLRMFGVEDKVVPIQKTSKAANKNWLKKIDLLHVDGLHEYEFAKKDLQLWLPFLEDGGVVVCHDAFCQFPDVFRAVKEEIFTKDCSFIAASDSQIMAVKGKPKNLWQKINVSRQKFFLTLASEIWHNNALPENLRFFLVNRLLKIFFMNVFMFKTMLKLDL